MFIDSQSLCFVWEIYFDHIVGANTHIGTYPVTADHGNTKLKKEKNYQGRKLKKATAGVQNFYGLKMVFHEPTFTFYLSLQKVKPLSLYVLYSLKSEMKLASSPCSFPASQRNEYIPCKVLKAKSKRICDLVTIQCRSFYRVKRKSDA